MNFFDVVRPMFNGKLTQGQVNGMNRILAYAAEIGCSRAHLAYILATIYHETARWMEPIREGARRYGPNYSDASARRAVAAIYAKGIISRNYALPNAAGLSFYGRGLVQITHEENYAKFNIADNPDAALEWDTALEITFRGMAEGMFTGKSLADVAEVGEQDYTNDRIVINGDVRKNGARIAKYANTFYDALEAYKPKEFDNERSNTDGAWPPRWWPF
ncbi:hypothetical protein HOR19_gp50 [Phage MedPE-SWcel-C56]|uniref:Glycoside hydrolase family 19 catalytic domain-containing protein n=1 Tax=Phage MedPE-SWcel-C56 TaxID=1871314 RepID=A0A1B1IY38_9CAUD|nr:hypothetical protein HOR19_gp50 [Phage MedPE-SWcel-C56]ANS06243.1 hypothetical protein [Phage MedPE-SWcel-C56]